MSTILVLVSMLSSAEVAYTTSHCSLAKEVANFVKCNFNRHMNVVNLEPDQDAARNLAGVLFRQFSQVEAIPSSMRSQPNCDNVK